MDPVQSFEPQPAYYVIRNLATALEDMEPADFDYSVESDAKAIEAYPMRRDGERLLALWQSGRATDVCHGHPSDVIVEGSYRSATGYDPMNGVSQLLQTEVMPGGQTRIPQVLVRDYPVLVRLTGS
jgi:hypothetical protein